MVSLRFCIRSIDLGTGTTFYTNPTREKRFGKRATAMRTGVWSWCSPPRRRRPSEPAQPTQPPQPPLSLCPPPPPAPKPPPLSNFEESVAEEDGLSDMDFSPLDDDAEPRQDAQQQLSNNMVMDTVSKKWTGNETDFERFHRIVATLGKDDNPLPDQSVFQVSQRTAQQWHENGQEHNNWFSHGITGHVIDIRTLTSQFSNTAGRRKHSS